MVYCYLHYSCPTETPTYFLACGHVNLCIISCLCYILSFFIDFLELCSVVYLVEITGESSVNVIAIQASVHLPFDHRMLVQNLTGQVCPCLI